MVLDAFASLISGKNEVFPSSIQRRKNDWETGASETHEYLVEAATTKYNNMAHRVNWKQVEANNFNLLSLTTKLQILESKFQTASSGKSSGSDKIKN